MTAMGKALGFAALVLSLGSAVLAQAPEAPLEFQGRWSATAGQSRTFWGTWTAQVPPDKPDTVEGSWALLDQNGLTLLEGTWAANKIRFGWQGAWAARTLTGQSFSGTWSADITGSSAKTFKQMLELTLQKDILGSWRSGSDHGRWRLVGSRPAAQDH